VQLDIKLDMHYGTTLNSLYNWVIFNMVNLKKY